MSNEASSRQLLEDFIETHRLNDIFRRNVEGHFDAYAHRLAKLATASPRPIIVGINGSQGSGKSTLSAYLSQIMPRLLGVDCHIISIDDFYLTRARRVKLASAVHPLLAIRG
ncbi:P-loop NTPase fold protein, partial [Luminiphilus sp.]|nr:P-loop NTPase fold protein [Luminiphilus sp.]